MYNSFCFLHEKRRRYLTFFSLMFLLYSIEGYCQNPSDTTLTDTTLNKDENRKYWVDTPLYSLYPWQPNGYGLKRGEAYFQNIYLFYNHVSFGVSDHFSIDFGVIPVVWAVWVSPKFSMPVIEDRFNLGCGLLVGDFLSEKNSGTSIAYGAATVGSRDNNVGLGFGYGKFRGSIARPIFTGSAMLRLSKKIYFLSENYFVNNDTFAKNKLHLFEFRFILKEIAVNTALIVQPSTSGAHYTPIVGATVPLSIFYRKKSSSSDTVRE